MDLVEPIKTPCRFPLLYQRLWVLALAFAACTLAATAPANAAGIQVNQQALAAEGELIALEVTTAPFVINRRYESMQGPSVSLPINLKALHSAGGKLALKSGPPITGGPLAVKAELPPCTAGTELWWFRGAKIEVLAADSELPSNPGFMCHFNIDVSGNERRALLPTVVGFSGRILVFTSGMTEFALPAGYGIPVASEENWALTFQALNHNLDGEHSFRHRITLYFNRHLALNVPLQAVTWTVPFVAPPIDGDGAAPSKLCTCCATPAMGLDARPDARGRFTMKDGRTASGHWVIPPGQWSWSNPVREFTNGLDRDRKLVATWTHVHPFAERVTLRAFDEGCTSPRDVFASQIKNVAQGVGLAEIGGLSIEKGIALPASSNYEIAVLYNNTSGVRQDAMASMGLYLTAPEWRLPPWTLTKQTGDLFCGVPQENLAPASVAPKSLAPEATATTTATQAAKAATSVEERAKNALFHRLPRFTENASPDDPPYRVKVSTTDGSFVFRVEPAWAPKTAATLKPLFARNLFANVAMTRGVPGFVLQVPHIIPESMPAVADRKFFYRLPAEPRSDLNHVAGMLSMAMWEGLPDSVTSSFSFMLGPARHLDGKYTIFGQIEDWENASQIVHAGVAAARDGRPSKIVRTEVLAE